MRHDRKVLWKLFSSTFALSAFTLGGGYVIVPLMRRKFVEQYHWIEEKDMLNMIAIAQASPGPVAVNASILLGYRLAGLAGALTAMLGTVLPPLIIITVISAFYEAFRDNRPVALVLKGMQAGVAAVIASVVLSLGAGIVKQKKWLSIALMIAVFAASALLRLNVVIIILLAGAAGLIDSLVREREAKL